MNSIELPPHNRSYTSYHVDLFMDIRVGVGEGANRVGGDL